MKPHSSRDTYGDEHYFSRNPFERNPLVDLYRCLPKWVDWLLLGLLVGWIAACWLIDCIFRNT